MITIISSTNRKGSFSIEVAQLYSAILNEIGAENQILDLRDLPKDFIFTALFENVGANPEFNAIQQMIDASDKFVFIIPEYNGSFPGVLKAFLDGLKFPGSFKGKAGALVGVSSGSMGSSLAMSHLTDILNYLGLFVLPIKPRIASVHKIMQNGQLTDAFLTKLIYEQAQQLIDFKCLNGKM